MFAKQQTILSKHQTELQPDRRPITSGASAAIQPSSPVTTPLYPAPQQSLIRPTTQDKAVSERVDDEPVAISSRLIVGPDVKLKGAEILDCDTLVVEGRVEATMDSRVIRIAEQGAFSGKVGIDIAEIFGAFDGELTARHQLIIHASGRVSGKIRYGTLLVEEGGTLSGDVQSLASATAATNPETAPRPQASAITEKETHAPMKPHLSTVSA